MHVGVTRFRVILAASTLVLSRRQSLWKLFVTSALPSGHMPVKDRKCIDATQSVTVHTPEPSGTVELGFRVSKLPSC